MHTVLICRNYQIATAQLLNCNHNLIDYSDYQDTSIPVVDFRNQHLWYQESKSLLEIQWNRRNPNQIGCRSVMSKIRPPKNARATQDSCVPGHHYHRGSLDMFS